jgi:hypothetical protein
VSGQHQDVSLHIHHQTQLGREIGQSVREKREGTILLYCLQWGPIADLMSSSLRGLVGEETILCWKIFFSNMILFCTWACVQVDFCNPVFKNTTLWKQWYSLQLPKTSSMCYNSLLLALGVVSEVGLWYQLHVILVVIPFLSWFLLGTHFRSFCLKMYKIVKLKIKLIVEIAYVLMIRVRQTIDNNYIELKVL